MRAYIVRDPVGYMAHRECGNRMAYWQRTTRATEKTTGSMTSSLLHGNIKVLMASAVWTTKKQKRRGWLNFCLEAVQMSFRICFSLYIVYYSLCCVCVCSFPYSCPWCRFIYNAARSTGRPKPLTNCRERARTHKHTERRKYVARWKPYDFVILLMSSRHRRVYNTHM